MKFSQMGTIKMSSEKTNKNRGGVFIALHVMYLSHYMSTSTVENSENNCELQTKNKSVINGS
jgi:hypothetical protein